MFAVGITTLSVLVSSIGAFAFVYNGDTYNVNDEVSFYSSSASGYVETTGPSRSTVDVKAEGRFEDASGNSWGYTYDFDDTDAYVSLYSSKYAYLAVARNSVVNSGHTEYLSSQVFYIYN